MTNYISHGVLSPSFEEAEAFLTPLAGKNAQFTFQTFDDVKVWSEEKQKMIPRKDTPNAPNVVRVLNGTFNQHKDALAALNAKGAGVYVTVNQTDLKEQGWLIISSRVRHIAPCGASHFIANYVLQTLPLARAA